MTSCSAAFAKLDNRSQKQEFVEKDEKLSIRRQCELLELNRSTLYYQSHQLNESAIQEKEALMARLDYWHTMLPCCGSRKLVCLLRNEGFSIGRKRVRSLMAEMGYRVIYPKANLSKRDHDTVILPYLLKNKKVFLPNQVWSIDITYIKFHRSHMYLAAIVDWYSRKVLAWNLSDTLETELVLTAVKEAVSRYGTPAIINSDQGSQFTSKEYRELLLHLGIRQSMDGKSRWADNIFVERWFRSIKTELIYINEFNTPKELRSGISGYILQYNAVRPHEALDFQTPDQVYDEVFSDKSITDLDSERLVG